MPAAEPDRLVAELVLARARAGHLTEATEQLRGVAPWLTASLIEWHQRSVTAADALLPYVEVAEQGQDAPLAATLRGEALRLCRAARSDVLEVPFFAEGVMRVARALGDAPTCQWLDALGGDARLSLDFDRLEQLKASGDTAWEPLFDSLEERVEDLGAKYQEYAYRALLRCGLPRAAHRHWSRTSLHLDGALLAALWREELLTQYRSMVDSVQRTWVESPPRDWTWVGTAVDLAIARHEAGDTEGARVSAKLARDLAEENVLRATGSGSASPPEVATWSLAHLIPLEYKLGSEAAARRVLERARALLEGPVPAKASRKWNDVRVTTLGSLAEACAAVGWIEEAIAFTEDNATRTRYRLKVLCESGSLPAVQALFESVASPRERLTLALTGAADQMGPSPTWSFPSPGFWL